MKSMGRILNLIRAIAALGTGAFLSYVYILMKNDMGVFLIPMLITITIGILLLVGISTFFKHLTKEFNE